MAVWLIPPDVAVTVRLLVPFGVAAWGEDPQPIRKNRISTDTATGNRTRVRAMASIESNRNANSTGTTRGMDTGGVGKGLGSTSAVVVTVSFAVTGVTPSAGVTDAGKIVHVASAGAPAQTSDTALLNPPIGVTVTVAVPEEPWLTLSVGGPLTLKSGGMFEPIPERVADWGLEVSLSVKTSFADSAAATEGLKVTPRMQDAPEATLLPHVLDEIAKSTLAAGGVIATPATLVMARAEFELFVRVTAWAALVVPTTTVPKFKLLGDRVTVGTKVSFATNASEVPFRVVWKAPGLGNTGRFAEEVDPVM